jgi:hypothetical protein
MCAMLRARLLLFLCLCAAGCGGRIAQEAGDTAADAALEAEASPGSDVPDSASACPAVAPGPGACNDLQGTGMGVPVDCVPGSAPTPSGGMIEDGTYVLQSSSFYGGCPATGEYDRITWAICGSSWATVQESALTSGDHYLHINATAAVGGSNVSLTLDCAPPGTPGESFGFDATPGTLTLYVYSYGSGEVRVDKFTRTGG